MIRSYKGIWPTIPDSCYVDESAQVIGDVVLGENASIWMNAVVRGDVHYIRIGANSNIQDNSVMHGMLNQWPVDRRRLGHRRPQRHAARLRGRRPLPHRHGRHHFERRAHRRRLDHRRRHADSRGDGDSARLAGDGRSRQSARPA